MTNYRSENGICQEMDLPSPDAAEDPELLLNAWLGELDTLTAVSTAFKIVLFVIILSIRLASRLIERSKRVRIIFMDFSSPTLWDIKVLHCSLRPYLE